MSPVSIKPSDAVKGGGILPLGVEMEIKSSRFAIWDYNGKGQPTVAMRQILKDPEGVEHTQYWSVGSPARYQVIEDGANLDGPAISEGSNFNIYVQSTVKAGFPENRIESVVSYEGTKATFTAIPAPKRPGLANQKEDAAIFIMEKVVTLPGTKGKTTKSVTSPNGVTSDEILNAAVEYAQQMVLENGGEILKKDLAAGVFKKDGLLATSKLKKDIGNVLFKAEFDKALTEAGMTVEGLLVKS